MKSVDKEEIGKLYENLQKKYLQSGCINESMTFWIPDIESVPSDLHDLAYQLNGIFAKYIRDNVDYDIFLMDRVVADGSYYNTDDNTKGVINLYTHKIPKSLIPKAISLLKYYMGEYNAKVVGEPHRDISNLTKQEVYRFPVEMQNVVENPPELNLSNINATNIMQLLGYDYSESYEIPANELLMKIEQVENNKYQIQNFTRDSESEGNFHIMGQSYDRIKDILNKIKTICGYALDHNVTHITVS